MLWLCVESCATALPAFLSFLKNIVLTYRVGSWGQHDIHSYMLIGAWILQKSTVSHSCDSPIACTWLSCFKRCFNSKTWTWHGITVPPLLLVEAMDGNTLGASAWSACPLPRSLTCPPGSQTLSTQLEKALFAQYRLEHAIFCHFVSQHHVSIHVTHVRQRSQIAPFWAAARRCFCRSHS